MTKYARHDFRGLNDIDNADSLTKTYAEIKARDEAKRLADKYKGTPTYLKLLSDILRDIADKQYDIHKRELEASRPENQEREQMTRAVIEELKAKYNLDNLDGIDG